MKSNYQWSTNFEGKKNAFEYFGMALGVCFGAMIGALIALCFICSLLFGINETWKKTNAELSEIGKTIERMQTDYAEEVTTRGFRPAKEIEHAEEDEPGASDLY